MRILSEQQWEVVDKIISCVSRQGDFDQDYPEDALTVSARVMLEENNCSTEVISSDEEPLTWGDLQTLAGIIRAEIVEP